MKMIDVLSTPVVGMGGAVTDGLGDDGTVKVRWRRKSPATSHTRARRTVGPTREDTKTENRGTDERGHQNG
jgi:hypothetical protein